MKKLLSMLAVSALVGTSASNLKPVFTNNVVNHGFKSNQLNKAVSITNENNTNPFINPFINPLIIKENIVSSAIISLPNGTVYVGTKNQGLWKSTDGIKIQQLTSGISNNLYISSLAVTPNGDIYVGTLSNGLYKSTDGINFEQIGGIPKKSFITSLSVASNSTIYIGRSDSTESVRNVYKSTDGITFTSMTGTSGVIFSLLVDSNGNVYAGTSTSDGKTGIIYKSNGTDAFTEVTKTKWAVQSLATDSNGVIYVGTRDYGTTSTHDGKVYKSTDGITFTSMTGTSGAVLSLATDSNGVIYVGTDNGLYKSNGLNPFIEDNKVSTNNVVNSVYVTPNGVIYVGTQNKGLYTINPINLLLNVNKPDTFDKSWPLYKGIVYNSVQKIDIKENLVAKAKLDNKNITIPTTDLDLANGQHTLVLTLKEEYKDSAVLFGGDNNTGQITYKLWVKTSIDKKDINYSTNTDDTDLTDLSLGFVSTTGNTINCPIIQTKSKDGSVHNAPLKISYDDALLDYSNSYYVQGTVDDTTNDFTATGTKQTLSPTTTIATDGTYRLHLVDMVNNTYDSYLELGASNWKLKGDFDYSELNQLKNELNVTVNLTDPKQLSLATGWLTKYEQIVSDLFEKSLKANGKGFDSEIKTELENDFKWFLKPLTYDIANEPKFDDGIDKDKLDKTIRDTSEKCLQDGLTDLPQNLNIDFKNVTDKQTLDNCKTWINNYEKYIKDNVSKWITDISNVASRGFATNDQFDQIKSYINGLPFNKYLKSVEWTPNLTASGYDDKYLQYVELDKLQSDTIDWVNQNIPEINQTYQNAIKVAESGLNLHGYSIDTLLNHKSIPQTKIEIDNFADGQSFHNWLQSQANIKFHGWQLAMGLGIGIPLFFIALGIAWFVRKATDPRYNPFAWARKKTRKRKSAMKSAISKSRKYEKSSDNASE